MIRVVLRHEYAATGALLGDFPPSELGELMERLEGATIFLPGEQREEQEVVLSGTSQFCPVGTGNPRIVYEILFTDPD